MKQRWKHLKTICRHKAVVFQECKSCGLIWQGLVHDLSKFSMIEFESSAKYFQGDRSPIEAEKESCGYSLAWQHHKGHNPHHWEYWIDYGENGEIIAQKIPWKYVIEMICDWIGAGKVYSGEEWTQAEPLNYYLRVRNGRHFHPDTEKLIIVLLELIRDDGLEAFHKKAKDPGYLYIDYVAFTKGGKWSIVKPFCQASDYLRYSRGAGDTYGFIPGFKDLIRAVLDLIASHLCVLSPFDSHLL